jgi:hypothetical protein
MVIARVLVLSGLFVIAGCGQSQDRSASGKEVADHLDNAADQSGPAAKQILEGAADEARQHPTMAPVDQPGSFAQDAMQKAGNAEAAQGAAPSSGAGAR